MRKILLTTVTVLAFAAMASAQTQVVKTSPLGLAFGNLNVTYERVLNQSSAVNFRVAYWYKVFGEEVNALGVGVGWRYFFTHAKKDVPAGFYLQPQATASFGDGFTFYGLGAEIGYQWVWNSGFVLDLGIGPMYRIFSGNEDELGFTFGTPVLPSATLAVGFAF